MDKHELNDNRHKLADKLPTLAKRIFSLTGQVYLGYGFHWSKIKSIGYLLWRVNNYDERYDFETQLTLEVIYEGLLEDVEKAEIDAQQYHNPLDH